MFWRVAIHGLALAMWLGGGWLPGLAQTQPASDAGSMEVRGLVRSRMRVEYRSELVAPVSQTPLSAGDTFQPGDLLVAFDCTRQKAQEEAAIAAEKAAAIEFNTKSRLQKRGAAGKDEAAYAQAAHEKARAEARGATAITSGCEVRAPFVGRVVEMNARPLELPPTDKPLLVFLDARRLELELVVPSKWLGWLKEGSPLAFTVDETGETHAARIVRIGAEVDAVSQTVRITAEVRDTGNLLLPGMSGSAIFAGEG